MDNEWVKIEGYDNYFVNKDGEVKNIKKGNILKPRDNGSGYDIVDLSKKGIKKTHAIHRLIGLAFIEKINENYDCVDHIDRNTKNNLLENLRWVDKSGNNRNKEIPNKHGYTGVYKKGETFCSAIRGENGKRIHLGTFATPEHAGDAYKKKYDEIMSIY
jgi:hypothetical protein